MKIKTLTNLTFQRNGVAGTCFYHCLVTVNDAKGVFIVTFEGTDTEPPETRQRDSRADIHSCRAVSLKHPLEKWRGDEFAYALNNYFAQHKTESLPFGIYSLTVNEKYTLTLNQ